MTDADLRDFEAEIRCLRAEVDRMRDYVARIEAWQDEFEHEMAPRTLPTIFRLGAWWADRPWRVRPGKPTASTDAPAPRPPAPASPDAPRGS